jgi:hypothetical protein
MPDRTDGSPALGGVKTEISKKRASAVMDPQSIKPDPPSKGSQISPGAVRATARGESPKKRRKVNHGQDNNRSPQIQ